MLFVVCWLLRIVILCFVCCDIACLAIVVGCSLCVVRCALFVVRSSLFVVRCVLLWGL